MPLSYFEFLVTRERMTTDVKLALLLNGAARSGPKGPWPPGNLKWSAISFTNYLYKIFWSCATSESLGKPET